MIDFFERKARFTGLEVWEIRCGGSRYQLFISDEQRKTELADLDLPDTRIEEDMRENLIKGVVYSGAPVEDAHIEALDCFTKQMTDHVALAHCHVVLTFQKDATKRSFERILREDYGVDYEAVPLEQLWHLNQD
ncbi:hypothetical protein GIW82_13000 [Planomicrobium sp. YIM 101495]|nr:hypothetical protein [Planomicrobium sp. YIM 101495]MTD31946.1 hypothetical protein [Planomicrobium sp. YIM 101495]